MNFRAPKRSGAFPNPLFCLIGALALRFCGNALGTGAALSFNGTNQWVQVGSGLFPDVTNNFTMEFWANPSAARAQTDEVNTGTPGTAQRYAIFPDEGQLAYGGGNAAGAGVSVGTNGISVVEHANGYLASLLVYNHAISGWTHIAVVYSNAQPQLYVNGNLVRTGLASTYAVYPSANMGEGGFGYGYYQGVLDEVRVWKVALDPLAIQTRMNQELSSNDPAYGNLIGYWRFNEGSGPRTTDSSNGRHAGLLRNGVVWVIPGAPILPVFGPGVAGDAVSQVATNSARLNGRVTPRGNETFAWFDWGLTTNYGFSTVPQDVGSGSSEVAVSEVLNQLSPDTIYHYRLSASNGAGLNITTDSQFSTYGPPTVATLGVAEPNEGGAWLLGSVKPNGFNTTAWFEYGLTANYESRTAASLLGAGTSGLIVSNMVTGFTNRALVHYRVVATNLCGTNYGADATFTTVGPAGTALQFDGLTTSVALPVLDLTWTNQLTIEAWVVPVGWFGPVINMESRVTGTKTWSLQFGASQELSFDLATSAGSGHADARYALEGFAGGPWHHVAATYDGNMIRLYHNGRFLSNAAVWGSIRPGATDHFIGFNVAGAHFNGQIDEVRIWSGARTQLELDQGRFQRLTGNEPGLVAYWRFDDASGNTAYDSSERGNNGALGGAIQWVYSGAPLSFPYVQTTGATLLGPASAVFNGEANPNQYATTTWFDWGTDTNYSGGRIEQVLGSGSQMLPISQSLDGLAADTTYHFRAVASNTNGLMIAADQSFVLSAKDKALRFDGLDGFVDLAPLDLSHTNQISLEAWIKPDELSVGDIIRQEIPSYTMPWPFPPPDWVLSFYGANLVFGLSTGGKYQALSIPIDANQFTDGQWHHIAATYDGSTKRVFHNGVLLGSDSQSGSVGFSSGALAIGSTVGGGGEFFQGLIDEVRIWQGARSLAEIIQTMNRPLSGAEPGLVASFPFREGTGVMTRDQGPHGYAGTLMNGPAWTVSDALNRPFCVTLPVTNVSNVTVSLTAAANPMGSNMAVWFQWGSTTNYGATTTPQFIGNGSEVVFVTQTLNSLLAGTDYHYRCVASNASGVFFSSDLAFETAGPTAITLPPGAVSATSMNLNGKVDNRGLPTRYWFEWGTSTAYGSSTLSQDINYSYVFTATVTNLTPSQTYHYRIMATNSDGLATGNDLVFTPSFTNALYRWGNLYRGSVAWGDYNRDGNLDLLATGTDNTNAYALIYQSDGTNLTVVPGSPESYWLNSAGLLGIKFGHGVWADFDNDGALDALLTGYTYWPRPNDGNPVSAIYRNAGTVFADMAAGLQGVGVGGVACADFDNDGKLDLLLTGITNATYFWWWDVAGHNPTNILYRNNGDGTFTDLPVGLPAVYDSSVAWGDFDNDGQLDLAIMGNAGTNYITRIYRNDHGTFTDIGAGLPGLCCGSLAWGDFDNDGQLDLLVVGQTNADSDSAICRIYRNDHGVFTDIGAGLPGVINGAGAWGDFDGDGQLDIALMGLDYSLPQTLWTTTDTTRIYRNSNGVFTDIGAGLPGASAGGIAWGDFDDDGRLDIALLGESAGLQVFRSFFPQASSNPYVPSPPSTPASSVLNNNVKLTWAAGADPHTPTPGLTYNVRIGTTPGGGNIVPAQSDLLSGRRRLPQMGNAEHRLFSTFTNLSLGVYYWSVQAVNNSFAGSAWAPEQMFTITNTPPVVATLPATNILCCSARLNGIVNPGGLPVYAWFEWGTNSDFGNTTAQVDLGKGIAPQPVQQALTGLQPLTTYFYRALATNSAGLVRGTNQTFTTYGPAPVIVTLGVSNVSYMSANVLGALVPGSLPADYFIEWGATTAYGHVTPAAVLNAALGFDGVDDALGVGWGKFPQITNNFTMELWAEPTASRAETGESGGDTAGLSAQRYAIFPEQGSIAYGYAPHAGAGLSIGTNGVSVMEHTDGLMPSVLVYTGALSGWTHVAVVYSNHVPSLLLNGVLARTGIPTGLTVHPSAGLGIATNLSYYGYTWNFGQYQGAVGGVRIWDTPLDAVTIQTWMDKQVTTDHPDYPHLQGYWPLTEGIGDTAFDHSLRANSGQLINGAYWTAGKDASGVVFGAVIGGLQDGSTYHFRVVAVNPGGTAHGADQTFTTLPLPRVLAVVPQIGGAWLLEFKGLPDSPYALQASTNLTDWVTLTNLVANPKGLFQFLDATATSLPTRFYRLKVP